MKKTVFFALAAMLAFAACEKSSPLQNEPNMMTLSIAAPSTETKTVVTPTGTGNIGLHQAWKVGDEVALVYTHDTEGVQREIFTCTEVKGDGSATFAGTSLMSTVTSAHNVHVYYPYNNGESFNFNNGKLLLDDLNEHMFMHGCFELNADGTVGTPLTTMDNETAILRIAAGTKILSGHTGSKEGITIKIGSSDGIVYRMLYNPTSYTTQSMTGDHIFQTGMLTMTNGCLDQDLFVPWHADTETKTISINFVIDNDHIYTLSSRSFENGKVYTISAARLTEKTGGSFLSY